MNIWKELKTQQQPRFVKVVAGRKRTRLNYELGLIYPLTRWSTKSYSRDEMGRNVELKLQNPKQRLKEIIPFWKEEVIYDFDNKRKIRYNELLEYVLTLKEIGQIFTLNNKVFVQIEDDIRMFGNKNIDDATRLFEILKEDVLSKNVGNFIFVKDVTTKQRIMLYDLLETKGYKRTELFRHYSY